MMEQDDELGWLRRAAPHRPTPTILVRIDLGLRLDGARSEASTMLEPRYTRSTHPQPTIAQWDTLPDDQRPRSFRFIAVQNLAWRIRECQTGERHRTIFRRSRDISDSLCKTLTGLSFCPCWNSAVVTFDTWQWRDRKTALSSEADIRVGSGLAENRGSPDSATTGRPVASLEREQDWTFAHFNSGRSRTSRTGTGF